MNNSETPVLFSIIIYAAAVLAVAAFMIGFSYLLGQRHTEPGTNEPFESGMDITGSARMKFPVHFYIVAMFFVIFDLEAVFLVAWAVSFKEVGWAGYAGAMVFIFLLLVVFIYEWRIGALNFGLSGKSVLKQMKKLQKLNS